MWIVEPFCRFMDKNFHVLGYCLERGLKKIAKDMVKPEDKVELSNTSSIRFYPNFSILSKLLRTKEEYKYGCSI
jgi:hypothetical protein